LAVDANHLVKSQDQIATLLTVDGLEVLRFRIAEVDPAFSVVVGVLD
jgi:hypothetical protein